MKSSIVKVSEILNEAESISSAGFSAGYSFNELMAAKYFDNLVENLNSEEPYFSGILIVEKKNNEYKVIDGIQRISSICLLLCALCKIYDGTSKQNEDAKNKIYERFLISKNEPKLNLPKSDNEIYKKILFSEVLSESDISSNIFKTYSCFVSKIRELKISGNKFFKLFSKIQFMTVFIENEEVSARELYQTINNNKGESQLNLIYDFVYQHDKRAKDSLKDIERLFKGNNHLFECYLRDFLITRIDAEIQDKSALYNNFKKYYYKISPYLNMEQIIDSIAKYSKYYLKIIKADFENEEIKEQINIINHSEEKDTYPYLMEVMDDLDNQHIDMEAFQNILKMINVFVKSRQNAGYQGLNINFSKLSRELNKMLVLKDYVPDFLSENKITINEINKLSDFEV